MGAEAGKDCSPTRYKPLDTFLSPKHVWHITRQKRDLLWSRSRRGRDAWSLGHIRGARTILPTKTRGSAYGGSPQVTPCKTFPFSRLQHSVAHSRSETRRLCATLVAMQHPRHCWEPSAALLDAAGGGIRNHAEPQCGTWGSHHDLPPPRCCHGDRRN